MPFLQETEDVSEGIDDAKRFENQMRNGTFDHCYSWRRKRYQVPIQRAIRNMMTTKDKALLNRASICWQEMYSSPKGFVLAKAGLCHHLLLIPIPKDTNIMGRSAHLSPRWLRTFPMNRPCTVGASCSLH